jgi:hypothetical protein
MSREEAWTYTESTRAVNEVYLVISRKYGEHFWLQDHEQILANLLGRDAAFPLGPP